MTIQSKAERMKQARKSLLRQMDEKEANIPSEPSPMKMLIITGAIFMIFIFIQAQSSHAVNQSNLSNGRQLQSMSLTVRMPDSLVVVEIPNDASLRDLYRAAEEQAGRCLELFFQGEKLERSEDSISDNGLSQQAEIQASPTSFEEKWTIVVTIHCRMYPIGNEAYTMKNIDFADEDGFIPKDLREFLLTMRGEIAHDPDLEHTPSELTMVDDNVTYETSMSDHLQPLVDRGYDCSVNIEGGGEVIYWRITVTPKAKEADTGKITIEDY